MYGGQGIDHRELHLGAVLVGTFGDPTVTEGVREYVGWYGAIDPAHHHEGRTEHVGIVLEPHGWWYRRGGVVGDQSQHLELLAEVIAGEHRHLVHLRLDASNARGDLFTFVLVGPKGEQQGLRRHPVADRAGHVEHGRPGAGRQHIGQPPLETAGQILGISGRGGEPTFGFR